MRSPNKNYVEEHAARRDTRFSQSAFASSLLRHVIMRLTAGRFVRRRRVQTEPCAHALLPRAARAFALFDLR